MTSFRSVLAIPGSARLFGSGLLARLPQGMGSLAILLLIHGTTHSYAAAGVAVGAYALANAVIAPLQGRLVDRFGRQRVLVPSGMAQGACLCLLVLCAHAHAPTAILVVVCGLAGALQPPYAPTVRALLREVVLDPGTREAAYALDSVAQELIWITGPLLVAIVIGATSPTGAVLVVAGLAVVGSLVFISSPLTRRPARPHDRAHPRAALSAGLRALLGPVFLVGMALGAIEVGIPSLAIHAGARWASGPLLALWSVGSIAGGLWYGSRSWRISLQARYRYLLAAGVICTAPLIFVRSIPAGLVASLIAGLTTAPMFSAQYTLVGRTVRPGSETEAFAWVAGALISGIAAGSAAGGAVIGPAGVSGPFVLACLATGLAALIAFRSHVAAPEVEPAAVEAQLGSLEPVCSRSSTPASSS